jgi:hypothetical protein
VDPGLTWTFGTADGYVGLDGEDRVLPAVAERFCDLAAAVFEPHTPALGLQASGAVAAVSRRPAC